MVAPAKKNRSRRSVPAWHKAFLGMLPAILRHAKAAFAYLKPEARGEAVQETVANACQAYARLVKQGKTDVAHALSLARYGVKQTRDHRKVGGQLNVKDVLSKYCQDRKGVVVQRLDKFNEQDDCWEEAVVQDTRNSPVADTVAFRVDFAAWLKSLKRRDRRIAEFLSLGHRTSHAARKFKVSQGRVSQLRRELAESWRRFVGDEPGAGAAIAA